MEEVQYTDGQEIEVSSREEGLKDAWFPAKVIEGRKARRSKMKKVLIEYKTLRANMRGSRPLREYADDSLLRPQPPQEENAYLYQLHDVVDAYINDGWRKGVIAEVLEDSRYKVCFRNSNETTEFGMEELRIHRDWVNGRWDPPMQERGQETSFIQQNPDGVEPAMLSESIELNSEMDKTPMPVKACTVKGKSIGAFKSVEKKQLDLTGSFPENKRRKPNWKAPSFPEISQIPLMEKYDACGTNYQVMELSPEDVTKAQHSEVIDLSKTEVDWQKNQLLTLIPLSKKIPLGNIAIRKQEVGPTDMQKENDLRTKRTSTEEINSSREIKGDSTDIQCMQTEPNDVVARSVEMQKFSTVNEVSNSIEHQLVLVVHQNTVADEDNEATLEYFPFDATSTKENLSCHELNRPSSPLPLGESDIPRSLPFVKSSWLMPLWEAVGSMSAFKSIPQQPHFRGLENWNENLREGMALGWTISYGQLVEQTCSMTPDEPRHSFEKKLLALVSFEELGFTVDPIRSRLEEMLKIKDGLKKLEDDSKKAEIDIVKEKDHDSALEVRIQDMQMQINEIQKTIMEMSKTLQSVMTEKERTTSTVSELEKTVAEYRHSIMAAKLDFQRVVSAPW